MHSFSATYIHALPIKIYQLAVYGLVRTRRGSEKHVAHCPLPRIMCEGEGRRWSWLKSASGTETPAPLCWYVRCENGCSVLLGRKSIRNLGSGNSARTLIWFCLLVLEECVLYSRSLWSVHHAFALWELCIYKNINKG